MAVFDGMGGESCGEMAAFLASEEFGTDFNSGIKTVRADFLADHTLSLTFSEYPATEGMMEHLKDIVNGLLN